MNRTILLLGPTGSGKGTQGQLLAQERGYVHLSSGDLIRGEIAAGTDLGERLGAGYARGDLAADEEIIPLFRDALLQLPEHSDVVLDGFPRTLPQAEALDGLLGSLGRRVDRAILLEIRPETSQKRLGERRICPDCGRIFSEAVAHCPDDGAIPQLRRDDRPEAVGEKFAIFEREIRSLKAFYGGRLVSVDGEGSIEEVAREMERATDDL